MSEDKNERDFDFPLEFPFNYGSKGGTQESASFIRLIPPTTNHSRECAYLRQAFFRAANDQADDTDDAGPATEPKPPTAEGIMAVISMSSSVDLPDLLDVAKKLFSNGVAFIEGEVKLTKHTIGSMDEIDFETMLGEFLVNFIVASAVARARNKNSTT